MFNFLSHIWIDFLLYMKHGPAKSIQKSKIKLKYLLERKGMNEFIYK